MKKLITVKKYSLTCSPETVSLRTNAQKRLKKEQDAPPPSAAETLKTLHELENRQALLQEMQNAELRVMDTKITHLHELEVQLAKLEMQNKELVATRKNLNMSLKRHLFVYDNSPTGYFSVDKSGAISEMNYSGARLLGKEKSLLINKNLNFFISPESRHVFRDFLQKAFETGYRQTCKVRLISETNSPVYVHFNAVFYEVEQKCFIAGTDVSNFCL